MLCENCHQNEATCHICTVVRGVSQSSNLCDACAGSGLPGLSGLLEAQRDARCVYCGGHPCGTGPDLLAMSMGVQTLKFLCMPCSQEYMQFLQPHLEAALQDASLLSVEEQSEILPQLARDVDAHMRQWVSERGS